MTKKALRISRPCWRLIEPLEQRIAPATFTVINTLDSGRGSLRDGITFANNNPGPDTINFNILGAAGGVKTIALTSALPAVFGPVIIDGYTQPGSSPNTLGADFGTNATLLIELNGAGAGTGVSGLTLNGTGSTIRGLVINRFTGHGINGSGISGDTIEGNFIGTNAAGTAALGNGGDGIVLDQSSNNTIGGTAPAARNLIAGNSGAGVRIGGQVTFSNTVAGNLIGINAAGDAILGAGRVGIALENIANGNIIGGTVVAARNVIAGSTGHGISIDGANSNTIQGNYIGTDVTGKIALGNSGAGVFISQSAGNRIGTAPLGGNLIANSGLDGIALAASASTGNGISGNRIFDNGGLGIDLGDDGVTASGAPVITSALVAAGSTTITGTLHSGVSTTYTIELFASNAADPSGFGEGQVFIGSTSVTTDGSANGTFTASFRANYTNLFISATTITDSNDTSEFSQAIKAAPVATTYVWDAGGRDTSWFTPLNWNPDGIPGAGDTAILNINSTIILPSDATVASFQQITGTFGGAGKLTIASSGTFAGGVLDGPGITFIPFGSTLAISGATDKQIDGRTLALAGTVTLSGTGNLRTEFDGTVDIQPGGLFDVQSDVSLVAFGGAGFGFVKNAGTFQKSGGTGTTSFSNGGQNVTLDNSGTVRALTGTILVPHGGISTAGTFDAASGAFIDFNAGYTFNAGTQFTGGGAVRLLSGTQTLSGALTSTNLVFQGATIAGTHIITGTTSWSAGILDGPGTTTIPAGSTLAISGSADKQLAGRTLTVAGTATLSGTGNLRTEFDGTINIQTGALFDVQSDVSLVAFGGAGFGTVNNAGTFQKSGGTGTTSFSNGGQTVTLNNSGVVRAFTGAILVAHGGTSTAGIFDAVPGALIDFNAAYTFNTGTQFTGGGEVRLLAGTQTLAGAISSTNLKLAGATVAGSHTLTGNLEWRSGSITGATTLPSGAALSLTGPAEKLLDGGSVTNSGTITWGGGGNWRMGFGAAISNLAGGSFEIQGDASMSIGGGDGNGTFTNAGLLRKSNGTGTTSIGGGQGPSFSNSGIVDVASGTLSFQLSFTQTGGVTQLNGGNLGGGILLAFQGGDLLGAGTITGSVGNTGATVRPGGIGAAGTLSITGDYTQSAGGTLAVELGGTTAGREYDQLSVGATATLDGSLNVAFINGFTPAKGDVFNVVTASSRTGSFSSVTGAGSLTANYTATQAQLLVAGNTFVWDAGAGAADMSWFTPANWNPDGVPGASDTATLNIKAPINLPRDTSVAIFNQSDGVFTSPGGVTFTVLNNFNWTGGAQTGAGTTTIAAGATLSHSAGGQDTPLDQRTLNLNGAAIFPSIFGGGIALSNGASINNTGVIDFRGPVTFLGSGTINNLAGATLKNTTTNHTVIVENGIAFTNAGLVDSQIGALGFNGGYTQIAGTTQLNGGSIIVSGTLALTGGEFTGSGTFVGSINNSGGVIHPGGANVIGTITINGDYIQGAGGTLETELAGTNAGQFDVLAIGGVASLGGTLTAPLLRGFTPPAGSQFQTITAGGSISGAFNIPPPNVGIQYAARSVTLLGPVAPPSLVVTTELDVVDPSDGLTSLREAILFSNTNAGTDAIIFNIPGTGVHSIRPASALPIITDPVIINGFSQPGASPNTNGPGAVDNAVRLIEVNGASNPVGAGLDGLRISGGGSTIQGLIVTRFEGSGIVLATGGGNVIAGNLVGGDVNAPSQQANGLDGISIINSPGNTIGGATPADRNRFVGNGANGIAISGASATGNSVLGNFIGLGASGTSGFGNAGTGILITGGGGNTIGGTVAAARNIISGNKSVAGVDIGDSTGNIVLGNYIGTDLTGSLPVPNVIGVILRNAAVNNVIGGAAGNLISGNASWGVLIGGKTFGGPQPGTAVGNRVEGNLIGTDATGTRRLGNLQDGVSIDNDATNTTIGGSAPGAGNVISGNGRNGIVVVADPRGTGNAIVGNLIGTDKSGTLALGNGAAGVALSGAAGFTIGGLNTDDGNVIAFNGAAGVSIDATSRGVAIHGNSMHDNTGLGIDLGADGFTPNDTLDPDAGANNLQNFPVLDGVLNNTGAGTTTITGTLNTAPSTTVRIDFYTTTAVDGNGVGQGRSFIGFVDDLVTDSNGNVSFTRTIPGALATGTLVTATATDANGNNTSEFAVAVAPANGAVSVSISDASVAERQSGTVQAIFTLTLSEAVPQAVTVNFNTAPFAGAHSATGGIDYVPVVNGLVQFAPNQLTQTISVTVNGDTLGEARERFVVSLSNAVNAGIEDGDAVGVIRDDDHHLLVTGAGNSSLVRVFNATNGRLTDSFDAFGPGFRGGVRVATGDVNGDGVNDIIAGAGLAGGARVRVFDGVTLQPFPGVLGNLEAFGQFYRGGVHVAAGDVNGDGLADVIVAPSAGASGEVRIFDGADGSELSRFGAFGRGIGGLRVAAGDVNGDGRAEVIVGAGIGSHVRIFDVLAQTSDPISDFRAFGKSFHGGVYVAAGDVNGDGLDDVIAGAGTEGKTFRIFIAGKPEAPVLEQAAYAGALRGVRVATVDVNSDGIADIITGKSRGDAKVSLFDGRDLRQLFNLSGYSSAAKDGVFVG